MTDLRQAAQAVIDRWDSPLWKNGSTANAIADLRAALEQKQAEPVATHRITAWGHCGVCRHDRIPGEGCARQECPDSPQQQAEPVAVVDEVIHAAWAAGFVEGEKAALEQQAEPECWCHKCNENRLVNNIPFSMTRMILCPTCGNKRCPKASDHRLGCTDSNAAGQPGSAYPALPQRKPLTINEVEQILAQHNYEIHGDRARYIVRMTEEAHGIKEGT